MTVTIRDALVKVKTQKAILVDVDGEDYWIPLSQVDDESEVYESGDQGDLVITEWIAQQKGLTP